MLENIKNKNIFVTGADGFIGSHLVEQLVAGGANVTALVYYNSWNSIGWLADVDSKVLENIEIVGGDIRDADQMRHLIKNKDYVFHLASLIAIPFSYDAPRTYFETNVIGAINIAQGCRESDSLTRLLHVSTSETYGSAQQVPINENHPLVGQSPYSASKISADKAIESFYLSFDLPVVTARPFNTFGPRQTARAVIPTIASQLLAGKKELELGDLTPTRDFNYATDTSAGILALALCKQAEGETVNIGSGTEYSIAETVDLLKEITGNNASIKQDEQRIRPAKSEVNRLLADVSKLKNLTGWEAELSFKQGLAKTVKWIEQNQDKFDTNKYAK